MTAISPADGSPDAPTVTTVVAASVSIPSMVSSVIDQLHFRSAVSGGVR
jgi:hypothetical protein